MNPLTPSDEGVPPAPFQVKPQVRVPGGGMSISASAEALFRIIAPKLELFHRGGVVVEVAQEFCAKHHQPLDSDKLREIRFTCLRQLNGYPDEAELEVA